MANIISDSNERVKSLLVKAEALVHSRLELNTHSSVSDKATQHVYDLRAAIAVRESLKHDLDEHRQRRGKLNELHDELNRAEEKLTELRLNVTEHEIEQEENLQKVADIEKQLGIMTDDFVSLKEAVVPLMDHGGFLKTEIARLIVMQSEAEAEVEKKRQQVRETEENLHHIMNAGLSSQMWTNTSGSTRMGRRKSSFASPGQLASSVNAGGENLAGSFSMLTSGDEDDELPPYASQWTHKGDFVDVKIKTDEAARRMRYLQAEKKSRAQQLWTIAYNAIKLGLLTTRRLVFPRDTILKMQAYVHTEAMLMEANGAFKRKDQNPNQHLIDKIALLEELNQRLQRQMEQKSSSGKKSEVKLAALTTRYEKIRVEVAALRNVVATMGDKSVEQLIEENRRLDAERAILYAKLYGRKSKVDVPGIMDTQMLREASSPVSTAADSPQNSPAKSSPIAPAGSSPTRSRTVRDAVAAEQDSILRQRDEFYKAPNGVGFLQMQLDRHVANQQIHQRVMDRAYKRTMEITQRLEVAESLAMHAFDSFARGRQTVDEELESLAMEMQRMQKRLNDKMADEKKSYELQSTILRETITNLERDVDSGKNRISTLEQTNDSLRSKVAQLEEELETSHRELDDSRRLFSPEDLQDAATLLEKLNRYNGSDAVAYDFAIPRILPMKSQRAVTALVTNLIQAVHPPLVIIANNFHRVLKDSVRKTAASVSQSSTVITQLHSLFEQVTSNIALIARTELEAIENFEEHRRATLTSKETDVDDLPQPPPTVVEVAAAVVIPPDTEEAEVQAGPPRVHVRFANKQVEAEMARPSSHASTATDMVLGTGNAEAMGFASLDSVKRMEEVLRLQMKENTEALEGMRNREAILREKKKKMQQSLASFENQVMVSEDNAARAIRIIELAHSRQVNRAVAATQVERHDVSGGFQKDCSFQVYFRELDEQRFSSFAVGLPPQTAEGVGSLPISNERRNSSSSGGATAKQGASKLGKRPSIKPTTGTAATVAAAPQTSSLSRKLSSVSSFGEEAFDGATGAVEAFIDIDEQGMVVVPSPPRSTIGSPTKRTDSFSQTDPMVSESNDATSGSPAEQGLLPTFVPIQGKPTTASRNSLSATGPEDTAAAAVPHHVVVQSASTTLQPTGKDLVPATTTPSLFAASLSPPSQSVEEETQTDPVTIYAADFGESSFVGGDVAEAEMGMSPDNAAHTNDPVATAQMLSEMQEAMELTLREEYDRKREAMEQELVKREAEVQSQSDDIQRQALQLHVQVSDMQNGYEAVNASVNKFKYVAKRLLTTLQENRALKQANVDLQQKLGQSTVLYHPQATAIFEGTVSEVEPSCTDTTADIPSEVPVNHSTKSVKKTTFVAEVEDSAATSFSHPNKSNSNSAASSPQPTLRRYNSLVLGSSSRSGSASSSSGPSPSSSHATTKDSSGNLQELKSLRRERDALTIQLETQKRTISDLETRLKSLEAELPIHPNLTTKKKTASSSLTRVAHKYSLSLSHADLEAVQNDGSGEVGRPNSPGRGGSPSSPTSPQEGGAKELSLMDAFAQRMETKVRDSNFSLLALTSTLKEEKQKRLDETAKLSEELALANAALSKIRQEEATWKGQLNKARKDSNDIEVKIRTLLEPQIASLQEEKNALEIASSREVKKLKREETRLNETIDKLSMEVVDAKDAQKRAEDALKRYVATSTGKVKSVVNLVPQLHSAIMETITQLHQSSTRQNPSDDEQHQIRADFQLTAHLMSLLEDERRGAGTAVDPSIAQADMALTHEKTMIRLAANVVDQDVRLLRQAVDVFVRGGALGRDAGSSAVSLLLQTPPPAVAPARSPRIKPHIQSATGKITCGDPELQPQQAPASSPPPVSYRGKVEIRSTKQQALKEKLNQPADLPKSVAGGAPQVPDQDNALFSLAPIAHLSPPPSSHGQRHHHLPPNAGVSGSGPQQRVPQLMVRPSSVQGNLFAATFASLGGGGAKDKEFSPPPQLSQRSHSALELTPPRAQASIATLNPRFPMKDFLGRTCQSTTSDRHYGPPVGGELSNVGVGIGPVVNNNIRVPTQAVLSVDSLPHAVHDGLPTRAASRQSDRLSRLRKTL